jgi:hypothetical protein
MNLKALSKHAGFLSVSGEMETSLLRHLPISYFAVRIKNHRGQINAKERHSK